MGGWVPGNYTIDMIIHINYYILHYIIIILSLLLVGMNGGPPPQSRSTKRYKFADFKFVKVLGKGSFGKVIQIRMYTVEPPLS